jgi:HSP20 family protein
VLEGNRKEFKPKDGDEVHRQERAFGTFKRGIPLPFRVQADKIEAGFKNGILSVKLPRHEAEKPRKIQIAASA